MEIETSIPAPPELPLERYAAVMGKTFPEVLLRGGRGVVRRAIAVMPPASASGVAGGLDSGSQAKVRGFKAIDRDLNRIFVPVKLKGKRKERISGAEMVRIHARHLRYKRPGAPMRRYGGPYYVDARKFKALGDKLRTHVGRLASGFVAAAQALRVAVPAWIARHGPARGTVQIELTGDTLYLEAVNYAPKVPSFIRTETQRRINYAIGYQANAMNRELHAVLLKRARETGFQVA